MTDKINEVRPGQPLSAKDKEALAKSNAEATAQAHKMAAEQRARDMQDGGNGKPVVQSVAESIKSKLEKEDFQKPE